MNAAYEKLIEHLDQQHVKYSADGGNGSRYTQHPTHAAFACVPDSTAGWCGLRRRTCQRVDQCSITNKEQGGSILRNLCGNHGINMFASSRDDSNSISISPGLKIARSSLIS